MRVHPLHPIIVTQSSRGELGPADHSGTHSDVELIALWLGTKRSAHTRSAYARDAQHFLSFMAGLGREMRTATAHDVFRWADQLKGAPRTRARRVSTIKSLFTFAHKLGYVPFNVSAIVPVPTVHNDLAERILPVEGVRALIGALEGRDRLLVSLLYQTGLRIAEACALQWQHLHLLGDGCVALTVHGKRGKTRHVRIPVQLAQELRAARGASSNGSPMFSSRAGRPLHPANVWKMLAAACQRAGLPRISPHWLRHACASHALDNGAPIHVVQATLGHASLTTTGRYLHAKPTDSAGMYLKL